MYGDKDEKQQRLKKIVALAARSARGITQAALARALGVTRATINKDLVALHKRGVRLAEDDKGRILLPD